MSEQYATPTDYEAGQNMKLTGEDLKKKIFESLDNAVDNGYELKEWPAENIALDLAEYDEFFESYTQPELVPHIVEWLLK